MIEESNDSQLGAQSRQMRAAQDVCMDGDRVKQQSEKSQKIVRICDLEIFDYPASSELERHLRRYSMLFVDSSRIREGRHSVVYGMTNSWGELFAVKISKGVSLDEECRCHKRVSKRLGFPRLYARGRVDGKDALIMEWLEGETLERVREKFALDDKGRMSPLAAGRIGRDLCNILGCLDASDEGIAHRDISTTNILFRTNALSVPQQISEGTFDVCLIDFGSALDIKSSSSASTEIVVAQAQGDRDPRSATSATSGTPNANDASHAADTSDAPSVSGVSNVSTAEFVATPAFAAPELLTKNRSDTRDLQSATACDVYAIGSILYLLLTGYLPYELPDDVADRNIIEIARERKLHDSPRPMSCVHSLTSDLASVLSADPEVAVAAGYAISDYRAPLTPQDLSIALNLVDEQICEIVLSTLKVDPSLRPTFADLEAMLATFCENYGENIGRALRDEPLISYYPKRGLKALSHQAQTLIKRIGQGVCVAIGAVVWVSSAMLLDGLPFYVDVSGFSISGNLSLIAVMAALATPSVIGYLARWKSISTAKGLIRGSIGLAVAWAALIIFSSTMVIDNQNASYFLFSSALTLIATAWCPMVLDYAFPSFNTRRRKGLPASSWQDIFVLSDSLDDLAKLPAAKRELPESISVSTVQDREGE